MLYVINGKNRRDHEMKLPLSVLMYRLTEDHGCGYETVNADVSMEDVYKRQAPNELYSFRAFLVSMILKFQRFRVICDIINV